jgi:hypothetical protein
VVFWPTIAPVPPSYSGNFIRTRLTGKSAALLSKEVYLLGGVGKYRALSTKKGHIGRKQMRKTQPKFLKGNPKTEKATEGLNEHTTHLCLSKKVGLCTGKTKESPVEDKIQSSWRAV